MNIQDLRKEMDAIDEQLLQLFAQRMQVSALISQYKKEHDLPIFDPIREREKLNAVGKAAGIELSSHAKVLYSLLFELSRSYQSQLQSNHSQLSHHISHAIENTGKLFPPRAALACFGQEDHALISACERIFKEPQPFFFNSVDAVFSAVGQGMCQYGILPLEDANSSSVKSVYEGLLAHNFYIARSFRVQNESGSRIRYVCISSRLEIYPGADRTSTMMILPHKPGALYRVLSRLYVLGINVTRLESRPIPDRDYDFRFYFDLDTSIYSDEFLRLMCELDDLCKEFGYLGSYSEVI